MARYLITVDVGNSRVKFGLFDRDAERPDRTLAVCSNSAVVAAGGDFPWNDVESWLPDAAPGAISGIVAGANPAEVSRVLQTWPEELCPRPAVVGGPQELPLEIRVEAPLKVGIDRLLNAIAANVVRPSVRPAIIVDAGTATTVDCVSADGAFVGGAILPGFELMARSLHRYTALLPSISIEELAAEPHDPLGKNTRAALRSGLFWGQVGGVKELISKLKAETPGARPLLLLTGGGAPLLAPHLSEARWEPHLSLQGLALAADCRKSGW